MKTELNSYFHEKVLEEVGEVSVDSGQLLIVDPCYLRSHGLSEEALEEMQKDLRHLAYTPAIHVNLVGTPAVLVDTGDKPKEKYPLGFLTTTGYGDGGYKVYVERTAKEGRIKSVTVVFITEKQEAEGE